MVKLRLFQTAFKTWVSKFKTETEKKLRLRDAKSPRNETSRPVSQTLLRFQDRAQIFRDSCFSRNHFIPLRNDEILLSLIFSAEGGSFSLLHHFKVPHSPMLSWYTIKVIE